MSWHGIPIPFEGRDDWLEKRRAGIGASDVAGILGLSPWSTPFTVWASKVHGVEKEETEAMHFGRALEDVILNEFTERQGLYVGAREMLVRHPVHEWVMATVDGLAFEAVIHGPPDAPDEWEGEPLANVQVKNTGFGRWDKIPDHYEIQVQWEMLATGLDNTFLAVLHGGNRLEVYETEADPTIQQRLLGRVDLWREAHLLSEEENPPEPDASAATSKVITEIWSDPSDDAIELSAGMAADVEALQATRAQIKVMEERRDLLANRVKVAMQDATVGTVDGVPVVTWKQRAGFEVKARYQEPSRVLTVLKQKEMQHG